MGPPRWSSTRSATSTGWRRCSPTSGCAARGPRDPHPQRLRHRRLRAVDAQRLPIRGERCRRRAFDRLAVRDGDELTAGSHDHPRRGHPGPHRHPPVLRGLRGRADPGGLHRRLAALRQRRADRSGRRRRTEELTRAQYHSARRLAAELPDATPVYPTHGFGSFCSAGSATGGDGSTIGEEKRRNDALITEDEEPSSTPWSRA